MRTLTMAPVTVRLFPNSKYDETLARMQRDLDVCMEPDFVGDGAQWFSGVPLDILDEVLSTFKFNRKDNTLELVVSGGDVFAPISAYAAVMMELFSIEGRDYFSMPFTLIEVHQTAVSTTTSMMTVSVGSRGFTIKSIQKN